MFLPSPGRLINALLALLLLFGMAGCGEKSSESLVQDAERSQAKGDLLAAVIQLKNALQKNPNDGEARYVLGSVYNQLGEYGSAEQDLRRAQNLGAVRGGRVVSELGYALVNSGSYAKVLEEIKPAPGFESESVAGTHTARAYAHLALRQLEPARLSFDEALKAHPGFPGALLGQASLTLVEGDRDGAVKRIDDILAMTPKFFDAWMAKGDLMRQAVRNDEAVAAYSKALELRPAYVGALISRSLTLVSLGKLDQAQNDVDAIRKIGGQHPAANYAQALIWFRQGKYAEALAGAQQAFRAAPNYPPLLLLLGASHYPLGQFLQAEQYLSRFVAISPGNASGRKLLAATLVEMGQGPRALDAIQPLMGTELQDWVVLALAGSAEMKMGNYNKAAGLFEEAVTTEPKNPALRARLGISRLGSGDVERAIAELETAAELGASPSTSNFVIVMTHLRRKEYDKALAAIKALEKKEPKNPVTYNVMGAVYLGKDDAAAARKSFEQALELQPTFYPAAMNLAQLDLRERNPKAARQRFDGILAKDKNNLLALMALAKLAAVTRNYKESVSLLEQARQAHPSAVRPRIDLAAFYLANGQAQQALLLATEAERIKRDDPAVLDLLGRAQLTTGAKTNAVATFGKLAGMRPDSSESHLRLGMAHAATENYKAAETSLSKAVQLKPDNVEAQAALIMILSRTGRTDQAMRLALEMQKQYPKLALGRALEGDLLVAQKKFAQAAKAYEGAYELSKSGAFVVKSYMAQVQAGDREGGFIRLRRWVDQYPDDVVARRYLADGLLSTGQLKPALEHYTLLAQKTPGQAMVHNNMAVILQRLKNPNALASAERAYKLDPNNSIIGDTLGWILVEQGKPGKGLEYLEKAAERAPDNLETRYHLAVALAKTGERPKARRELEKLLASGKKFRGMDEAKALLGQL